MFFIFIYLCCHVAHTVSLGYLWAHVCSLLCYYSTAYRHIGLEKGKMVFENKMQTVDVLDHVYLVHPSTDISVDISVMIWTDTRPMYRSAYWPSVCRSTYGWVLVDMSTEMCQSTYRPMYQPRCRPSDGRHIDQLLADISVDIAADTRPILWSLIVGGISVDCR